MTTRELLRFTLVGDGSSDRALLPIISWLICDIAGNIPLEPQWADLGPLAPDEKSLGKRIRKALDYFPCHLLFVHRDSERTYDGERRFEEISRACANHQSQHPELLTVGVVPMRMMEAWFLLDEAAIRRAAGNPLGRAQLSLPGLKRIERVDAKDVLHQAIRDAGELTGRKAKKFNMAAAIHDVADFIGDFSRLNQLPSFLRFRSDLSHALKKLGLGRSTQA